jgi:endogenous inhibitor of DNA gyrase (YacG/DUF329 family)
MSKGKRSARPRTLERANARAGEKLVRQKEKLFLLEDGGTPERPIPVTSPVVVELKAAALACPRCGATVRLEEHRAPSVGGVRLREALVRCPRCGTQRSMWFRLIEASVN